MGRDAAARARATGTARREVRGAVSGGAVMVIATPVCIG
jgi:hypothetical protein